ncbi:flagellar biosynthesis protein FlhB [Alkalicoccobacillus porphyridii]|uniref:Flagellar biosynthetic protein FlhB n=1 Tax=Alkalicoccobacillus porphyridii TaxID=2597270 RepID=A0A553ZYI6_9BACI|nr:flagellar biosynthesis protein FlhB [Alkalicoccobacillus porphyridii]
MATIKMNLQYFADEKTEKATPKKRNETRKKGQVPKSTDVNTSLMMLVVFLFLWMYGGQMIITMFANMQREIFTHYLVADVTSESAASLFQSISFQAVLAVLPLMVLAAFAGSFGSFIQVGAMFSTEPLKAKLNKLDPIKGFKRIFSARALVELAKSVLKISLVGTTVVIMIWTNLEEVMLLSQKSVTDAMSMIGWLTIMMGLAVAILLMVLSIPDYIYQRYDHEKQIRMSKKDIKDEHKNIEGDPRIKSKRKQKQMELAMQRMMQEIPNADVVITNPTHFAIVLKYDEQKAEAPFVVAKGMDFSAQRIKKRAQEHGIPMVENKLLARALFHQTDIGQQVPPDLFKAVAEVLAYVYRLKESQSNELRSRT